MEEKRRVTDNVILAAMFLSIGLMLPMFTGQIKEIGDTLLPMHLPVMLCGLICGWKYGMAVGFVLPFFRSVLFGMPPLYPNAVWMAVELATYGAVIGFVYRRFNRSNTVGVYVSLLSAMIAGRLTWGISKAILLGLGGKTFTMAMFVTGGLLDAIPGIVVQLVLIPLVMGILNTRKVLK